MSDHDFFAKQVGKFLDYHHEGQVRRASIERFFIHDWPFGAHPTWMIRYLVGAKARYENVLCVQHINEVRL